MKNIAIILSKLKVFEEAKFELEQYPTDSEIAFEVLQYASMKGDIEDKIVMDLGCGTGILGIGALLLGAKRVYFIDKDRDALNTLRYNVKFIEEQFGMDLSDRIEIKEIEVTMLETTDFSDVDTVIQNPPFGMKSKVGDIIFLKKAMELSKIIYTFHIYDTKRFIGKLLESNDFRFTNTWRFKFILRSSMPHHKKIKQYIDVGCFRIQKQ